MSASLLFAIRSVRWAGVFVLGIASAFPAAAQLVGFNEIRPFVTSVIPVVGPGGAVGGVSVDAQGVLARSDTDAAGRLRDARLKALAPLHSELNASSSRRKISLRGLQEAIEQCRQSGRAVDEELQNLAGLTRVEFVFLDAEQHDIVIAGPAEGWRVDDHGNLVGRTSGQPPVQLDDLVVALRTAKAAASDRGISCSIDPTEEGLRRLRPLLNARGLNEAAISRLESALGTATNHRHGSAGEQSLCARPRIRRFSHEALGNEFRASADRGAAELPGAAASPFGPRAKERNAAVVDGAQLRAAAQGPRRSGLAASGQRSADARRGRPFAIGSAQPGKENGLVHKWAAAMTSRYDSLARAMPPFAELRNCMDLAVVAALLVKEDLPAKAGCDLSLLLDERRVAVAEYPVPQTVDSRASLVRKGASWILSLSGGVQVDSWSVLERTETSAELPAHRRTAIASRRERWWWD